MDVGVTGRRGPHCVTAPGVHSAAAGLGQNKFKQFLGYASEPQYVFTSHHPGAPLLPLLCSNYCMKCNFDDASPMGRIRGRGRKGEGGTLGLAVNMRGEGRHAPPDLYSRQHIFSPEPVQLSESGCL